MNDKIKFLVSQLTAKGDVLAPCSNEDIVRIEQYYDCMLPQTYKDLLLAMGRGAQLYMKGSSFFFNKIFDLKESAKELLLENSFKELPANAFVFFMHQGYQFAYFLLDSGDDPDVFYYYEGKTEDDFEKLELSLSEFLIKNVEYLE